LISGLIRGTVGQRVAERQAELEGVGPTLDGGPHDRDGRVWFRPRGGDERDDGRPAVTPHALEHLRDAVAHVPIADPIAKLAPLKIA
jgi:hypothetical protein